MPPTSSPDAGRIVALDWLRTLAVASLFFYHSGLVYSAPGSYGFVVVDPAGSWTVGPLLTAVSTWRMPLMFLIAGISAETMLHRRAASTFLRLRAKRLIPPFVMGMVLLAAPQRYFDDGARTYAVESAGTFARRAMPSILDGDVPQYHLWFLVSLGLLTIAATVVRGAVRTGAPGAGRRTIAAAKRIAATRAFPVLLLAASLVAALVHAPPSRVAAALTLPAGLNGAALLYYGLFFGVGIILARTPTAFATLEGHRHTAAALAAAVSVALAALLLADASGRVLLPIVHVAGRTVQLTGWVGTAAWGAAAWFGVLAALGFGLRHLTRVTPALLYLRDASFAWYLLHQTIIVVLAHYTARSSLLPPAIEYVLLVAATFAITAALYELPIRRTRVGRVLFGLPERVAGAVPPPMRRPSRANWARWASRGDIAAASADA